MIWAFPKSFAANLLHLTPAGIDKCLFCRSYREILRQKRKKSNFRTSSRKVIWALVKCSALCTCCVLLWRSLDLLAALRASTDITSTCTALFPPSIHLSTNKLFHFLFEKKSFQKFYDIWSSCSENTYKCTLKTELNEYVNSLVYLLQDWMKNHRATIVMVDGWGHMKA